MANFDQLPADQRAIIELVLQRGQTYDDLSDMLGMTPARVRDLARDALADLTPATARRVDNDWRGQVADYVLGQQSGPESTATRGHLKRSESARTWALSLLDALDPLYGNGARPDIPEGDAGAAASRRTRERRPATAGRAPRERRPGRPERSAGPLSADAQAAVKRRRIIAAAGAALAVLFVLLVWPVGLLTGGDDDEGGDDTQQAQQDVRIVGSPILLEGVSGSDGEGSAVVAQRGEEERVLIVQAQGLEPTPQNPTEEDPGFAYEVWLYNGQDDAVSIGAQLTDEQGNLQGAAPVPPNFQDYRFLDMSREPIDEEQGHSGRSVLRGSISDLTQPVPPQGAEGQGGQAPPQEEQPAP
ncbi:MAG: sigma factor-like helix-turn-helix DNA-binding protein [Thermoleophilaceae bacterium]